MQPVVCEWEGKFIYKIKVQTLECKWENAIFFLARYELGLGGDSNTLTINSVFKNLMRNFSDC